MAEHVVRGFHLQHVARADPFAYAVGRREDAVASRPHHGYQDGERLDGARGVDRLVIALGDERPQQGGQCLRDTSSRLYRRRSSTSWRVTNDSSAKSPVERVLMDRDDDFRPVGLRVEGDASGTGAAAVEIGRARLLELHDALAAVADGDVHAMLDEVARHRDWLRDVLLGR